MATCGRLDWAFVRTIGAKDGGVHAKFGPLTPREVESQPVKLVAQACHSAVKAKQPGAEGCF